VIIALVVAVALAGLFAGIAAHQRVMLREARYENSAYQDQEVGQAETIGDLRAQIRAHETSLTMIMAEVGR
jgi:hypothetical protein